MGQPLGQLRVAPVCLGERKGFVLAWAADQNVDPYHEMFFYPKDTLKLAVYDEHGTRLWSRDLGRGMPPGNWFCPVFAFDLDSDGTDEIYHLANPDADHPFAVSKYQLERRDALTGELLGSWPWPRPIDKSPSGMFRNFIFGGHANGEPILVTAQGTYGGMKLQGWNKDMTRRWEYVIAPDSPGARGSHMCPIVDFDSDGVDEVLWGERRIELDTGKELWCADREVYRGHTDIVQPFHFPVEDAWYVFTCREKDLPVKPRIATFDSDGKRIWGALDHGHIDTGWVAHLLDETDFVAMGVRIGGKTMGPDGLVRAGVETFAYDARTGVPVTLPFDPYGTLPVDLNADGIHELVHGISHGNGNVIDGRGNLIGNVGGEVAFVGHWLDLPGEQIVSFDPTGMVRIWHDRNAVSNPKAERRYAHPYYRANLRLSATGYNLINLSGL